MFHDDFPRCRGLGDFLRAGRSTGELGALSRCFSAQGSEAGVAGPPQTAASQHGDGPSTQEVPPVASTSGKSQGKKDLVMVFTCTKCGTRAAKAFSRDSYERGVVIVECPGCQARHLVADHLGWFGSKGNVEDFAREKGNVAVRKADDGTMELTPEDVLGKELAEKAGLGTS